MARSTPRVEDGTLLGLDGQAGAIAVGTPAWYAWLEQATTFAFTGEQGGFTARKERSGRTGWYWKAYRKRESTLHHAYLGKSADLTLDRLNTIASDLARRAVERLALESTIAVGMARAAPDAEAPAIPIASLPTGTLTFLFTDVEGSTMLWEQHPQAMPAALARHDTILREVVAAHGGSVFKTVGDSVHATFRVAADALTAALAAQRTLATEPWGATGPLRVRMALHTGVAELRDGDYYGSPLNRVARILALGHGGRILLSRATHDLVADDLPPQTTLRDLGEQYLKDLSRPEQIYQFISPDLPSEFPPLRTLDPRPARPSAQPPPLLATKLYVPPPRPHFVPRPRLTARLTEGLAGKLTLIAAPAGFGKSTLVNTWRATPAGSDIPVAWVSLDASDKDPICFWSYVIAALDQIEPGVGATSLAQLQSLQPPPMEAILTSLLNALSAMPAQAVLVLDDYHVIDTPATHQAMAFLLDHLPLQLHLIIATRVDPPLPLTRLRAQGQLTEVRAADLRFTPDEAATFLMEVMGLPLTRDEVAALEARTEGWIAGLQLAALAMRDRKDRAGFITAFTGSNRFVMDYLSEEVIERLPHHLQSFVLQTSILDRMCGPLCDAVLLDDLSVSQPGVQHAPSAYSQALLEDLERTNLFLTALDDERRWYRYHHLFAEVVRTRLTSGASVEAVATLHRRASLWFEQAGLLDEAVLHAVAAADTDRVVALIEHYAWDMLQRSEVLRLRVWMAHMPSTVVLARPRLALAAGWTLVLAGQLDAFEQLLQNAAALNASDLPADIAGELALLRSWVVRGRGDTAGMLTLAQQALELLPTAHRGLRAWATFNVASALIRRGDTAAATHMLVEAGALAEAAGAQWVALGALCELGGLQIRKGQLSQAVQTLSRAMQLASQWDERPLPAAGLAYVFHGQVVYERNDLDRATQELTYGVDLLRSSFEEMELVRGYVALAQTQQARGDGVGALATLRQGEEWLAQMQIHSPAALALFAAQRARLWIRQGNLADAAGWVQVCAFAEDSDIAVIQHLTLVRFHLAQYRREKDRQSIHHATETLATLLVTAEAGGWTGQVIEILILQALACQAEGDVGGSLSTLARAITLAEGESYTRIFVDEGAPMADLLRTAQTRGMMPAYVAKLLPAFSRTEGRGLRTEAAEFIHSVLSPQSSALVEPLTDRELEVLRLIAAGRSNVEIAQALVVAVSTIKTHVNRIFGKLGATSRTHAVARAHELHLL